MFRPEEEGVRCGLWRDDQLLLVRHSYGDRGWLLPGGRLKRGEEHAAGARREIRQEVGADLADWREVGCVESTTLYKLDRTFYLHARVGDADLRFDSPEFSEVIWWRGDDLPDPPSPALVAAAKRGLLSPP